MSSTTKPVPLNHVWDYTDVDRAFWDEHLADWLPDTVFDAHTHINEPKYRLHVPTEEMRRQYWVNEISEPIGAATAERCYRTVYPGREFSCVAFGLPSLAYDIEGSNDGLQPEMVKRGWYSLAVIRPQWSAETVDGLLDREGVLGVKVYYSLISEDPNNRDKHIDASIFEFLPHHQLEVLNERKSWLTLHVPRAERLGHPVNIREVKELRRKYPDINVVLAHLGRCYTLPHAEEALPQLADDEGLYFDNSAVLNPDVHRYAFSLLGPGRILYGTDNPIFYMRGRRQWEGRTYTNRTNYPFYFNKEREAPEIEAGYTLFMYEALRAIKIAAEDVGLSRDDLELHFSGNARRIIERCCK